MSSSTSSTPSTNLPLPDTPTSGAGLRDNLHVFIAYDFSQPCCDNLDPSRLRPPGPASSSTSLALSPNLNASSPPRHPDVQTFKLLHQALF
ncbi:hypothetical protein D9619_008313 [Psilocybe cf. subviscida]|uniref:Uncharacterized protein n=1 Tax=Psilocybe cf. subviscida TaxID=2480587 RepID=A0A8H5BA88_9AGAR|nr:hypothetical protein D9619_008313 [Psilocybe cf. subviscida]